MEGASPFMCARQLFLLTPPKSSYPRPLLSRPQSAPVSPLAATLMDLPASVANKRLTAWLTPLDATLTKNRGWGRVLWLTRNPRKDFYPEEHGDDRRFRPCRKGTPLLLVGWSGVSLLRERQESSPLRRGQTQ